MRCAEVVQRTSYHQPLLYPMPRETRIFGGKPFLLEEAIRGDVALIRAWKVDEAGNAIFRYTANNFSAAMGRGAKLTIIEVSPCLSIFAIRVFVIAHLVSG